MPPFGFIGPAYASASPLVAAEQLINFRPQKVESPNARTPFVLLGTSGIAVFATLAAGLPSVRGEWTGNGRAFAVAGTHFYEVNALGGVTDYGGNSTANNNIADDGLPATIVAG